MSESWALVVGFLVPSVCLEETHPDRSPLLSSAPLAALLSYQDSYRHPFLTHLPVHPPTPLLFTNLEGKRQTLKHRYTPISCQPQFCGLTNLLLELRSPSHQRRASGAGNLLRCQLALRLAGLSGAIHPGEYGDTIRQLIHSCRGEVGDHTIPGEARGVGGNLPG
ncbi:hypothetical protein CRENBAI_006000 [Crenichthys baileyi]|uniref:Uncharacterized protein n=1 Tax=Crenichthys baileyi TaxID=28760 RepID=A0AAV9R176_9TELE